MESIAVKAKLSEFIATAANGIDGKIGVKVHFGRSKKPDSFLDPAIFEELKKHKEIEFIDSNTLYGGERSEEKRHLSLAEKHGFKPAFILPDEKTCNGIGQPIDAARKYAKILEISHFTGHKITGFGGPIKNIAMGLGTRTTKLWVHQASPPKLDFTKCKKCLWCETECEHLKYNGKGACTSCAACLGNCAAASFGFGSQFDVARRLVEAAASIKRELDMTHISVAEDPDIYCDCMGDTRKPVTRGFLAVRDDNPAIVDYQMLRRFGRALVKHYKKQLLIGQIQYFRRVYGA